MFKKFTPRIQGKLGVFFNKRGALFTNCASFTLIFCNATDDEVEIASGEMTGYTKVIDVTSGTPAESETIPTTLPAKSFVILKK